MKLPSFDSMLPASWQIRRFAQKEQARMLALGAAIRERDATLARQFYAAADSGINRPTAPYLSTPEDYRQAYQRIIMIRYGRQMEDDIPYVESILSDFETYVVGDLRYRPNTGNKAADKKICEHLEFRFASADYGGTQDLTGLAKLAVRSKKRDGEAGFCYVQAEGTLKLKGVSADCIGNPLLSSNFGPCNYNGIVVDPVSETPVQYDLWRRIPKVNAYFFDRSVKANQFIHFFDPFRLTGQFHGVTAFKNAITRSIDIEQIVQFAIQNIKFRSSQIPAIQNELGKPKGPGSGYVAQPATTGGVPRPYQIAIEGVTQNFLQLDEGYVEFPHDFPNANFLEIKDDLKGDIAISVHLPGEFCFRSQAGGVLQRFYIEKAQRTFDEEKRLLRRQMLDPFKNRVLQNDVDAGLLDLDEFPGLAGSLDLFRGTWHMGRSVSTDYGHDTDSDIKLIDANLMSSEEYLGDNARDADEIRATKRARAQQIIEDTLAVSKATGQPFEVVLPFIQKQFPNPQLKVADTSASKDPAATV